MRVDAGALARHARPTSEPDMSTVFAPGCALLLHKPVLAERLREHLTSRGTIVAEHLTCCHHEPGLPSGTTIINVCPRRITPPAPTSSR
jgi:hypothetical protein